MTDSIGMVIMAAGKGTRMKHSLPKPLIPISGRRMMDFPLLESLFFAEKQGLNSHLYTVLGHQSQQIENHLKNYFPQVKTVLQREQKGTGDAIRSYLEAVPEAADHAYTLILCADTPLMTHRELEKIYQEMKTQNLDAVCASFKTDNPEGYGRIVSSKNGMGFKIIEEKDANSTEKLINEVNSGLYIVKTDYLMKKVSLLDNKNASGEFYLTDIFDEGEKVSSLCFSSADQFMGVNDLLQLSIADRKLKKRKAKELLQQGIYIMDPSHTYIDDTVSIGPGSIVSPNVFLRGNCVIGSNVMIDAGCVISDCEIGDNAKIFSHSHLEKARVGYESHIGPFARLREGTCLDQKVKIGNFVETKKVNLEKGVKVSHLSYVGDAEVGENTNIGCGFITCNYDGKNKHKTVIGKNCFIGSDSQTIAPVTIGDNCFVASGSSIGQSMPDGSFSISRGRQETKEGMAKRFLKRPS